MEATYYKTHAIVQAIHYKKVAWWKWSSIKERTTVEAPHYKKRAIVEMTYCKKRTIIEATYCKMLAIVK